MALPLSPSLRTLRIKVFDISILPDITKKMNNSKTKFIKSTFYLKLQCRQFSIITNRKIKS
jgi:hypothetical protein